MKNFEDFQTTIAHPQLKEWQKEVIETLNEKMNIDDYDDPFEYQVIFDRSYHARMMLKMLEAYHNWLND